MKPRQEKDLQIEIVRLAKLMAIDRSLPERRTKLMKLYHIPNGVKPQGMVKRAYRGRVIVHDPGTQAAARLGALEKALGVRRGMPDLHLPVASSMRSNGMPFLSLYLEVKLPGAKVPEYQRVIHEELRQDWNRVEVVRDTIEAERIFKQHLAL